VNSFQNNFHAKDSDIVVASMPKSGTTWLKGLAYAIVTRQLLFNPHKLVPQFEVSLYGCKDALLPQIDVSNMIESRLFTTHIPFLSLAKSVRRVQFLKNV